MSQERPQASKRQQQQQQQQQQPVAGDKTKLLASSLARPSPAVRSAPRGQPNPCNEDQQPRLGQRPASRLGQAGNSLEGPLEANLLSAANEGKVELVRLLLRCGANINAQDEQFGNTALHQAAWNGFSQTVQVLCKHRANTSIKNKALFTPLHMACQQGHNQTARLLLMANAKTETKNSYGDTPLHTAARYGHAGVARILLSAKCNPNQVNKNHDTPLHIAAAMGRRKLTKIFMQQGAEPAIQNKQNETPMDIALRKDLIDIQELIANPPPIRRSTSSSARPDNKCQLLKSGQLYTSGAELRAQEHKRRPASRQQRRRHAHLSSDDHSSELEHRLGKVTLRASGHALAEMQTRHERRRRNQNESSTSNNQRTNNSGRSKNRRNNDLHDQPEDNNSNNNEQQDRLSGSASNRADESKEIAVDVPEDLIENCRLVTRSGFSRSVHSLNHQAGAGRTGKVMGLMAAGSADLHLLTEARLRPAKKSPGAGSPTVAERDLGCPPDAQHDAMLPVIAVASPNGSPSHNDNSLASGQPQSPRKRSSPTGSVRSGKPTRGRLLVKQRKSAAAPPKGTERLGRKSNFGTCVGKLSLLRGMVNRRNRRKLQEIQDANDGGRQSSEILPNISKGADANGPPEVNGHQEDKEAKVEITSENRGRRAERQTLTGIRVNVAPNGTHLLVTRPLAPLADDTQLYAIPKKSKSAIRIQQQQVAVAEETAEAAPANNEQSTGPALVAADAKSSSSALSSNFSDGRATPAASSSSAIASSSDECVQSLDLIGRHKADRKQVAPGSGRRPAVVGLHGELDFDNSAPGYSVIGDLRCQEEEEEEDADQPCLCGRPESPTYGDHSDEPEQQPAPQQVASVNVPDNPSVGHEKIQFKSDRSKLRQFLQLKPTGSGRGAIAKTISEASLVAARLPEANSKGGYYAYSPVVQSSSELLPFEKEQPTSEMDDNNAGKGARMGAKSWLKSKFSLSSTSNINSTAQEPRDADQLEKQKLYRRAIVEDKQPLPVAKPPERRAELITIKEQPQSLALIVNEQLRLEDAAGKEKDQDKADGLEEDEEGAATAVASKESDELIRPKSALSATSADLIAAQKSLAAAAAAKVKRDRMSKLASGGNGKSFSDAEQDDISASKESVLTVKTSGAIPFWPSNEHNHRHLSHLAHLGGQMNQPLVVANGRLVHSNYQGYHLLTSSTHRSGTNSVGMSDSSPSNNGAESDNSIQTTNGSANEIPQAESNSGNQPSALGILSRILLNNKSLYGNKTNSSSSTSNSTLKANAQPAPTSGGSSSVDSNASSSPLSSSSLSSPAMSNQSSKLDQLSSRSRCPIVLNGSEDVQEEASQSDLAAPKLPPKGVLKSRQLASHGTTLLLRPPPVNSSVGQQFGGSRAMDHMNGLPRVSSYTQLSAFPGSGQQNHPTERNLCNFHALGNHQNHLAAPTTTRQHLVRHPGNPLGSSLFQGAYGQVPHPASQRDLGSANRSAASSQLDLTSQPVKFEYYPEASWPAGRQHPARYLCCNDNSIQHGYSQTAADDDSIYIPYLTGARQNRDARHQAATPSARMMASGEMAAYTGSQGQPVNSRPRPKSSLGSVLMPGTSSTQASFNQQADRRLSYKPLCESNQVPSYYQQPSYGMYSEENFIYATDRLAAAYHSHHSELTVTPGGSGPIKQTPYKSLVQVNNHQPVSETTCANKTRVLVNGSLKGSPNGKEVESPESQKVELGPNESVTLL